VQDEVGEGSVDEGASDIAISESRISDCISSLTCLGAMDWGKSERRGGGEGRGTYGEVIVHVDVELALEGHGGEGWGEWVMGSGKMGEL
jgi:hypothetical protein